MAVSLSCSVTNVKTIGWLWNKSWANETLRDWSLRWVSDGYPILHSPETGPQHARQNCPGTSRISDYSWRCNDLCVHNNDVTSASWRLKKQRSSMTCSTVCSCWYKKSYQRFVLLSLCEGNPPAIGDGGFPLQWTCNTARVSFPVARVLRASQIQAATGSFLIGIPVKCLSANMQSILSKLI